METELVTKNKINKSFFLFVIIVFGIFLGYSLSEFFTAFLGSIMFYVLFKPWMEFFVKRKGWEKSSAALLVILTSFFIIMLPIIFFMGMLYNKTSYIINHPESIQAFVNHFKTEWNISVLNEKTLNDLKSYAAGIVPNILNAGLSVFTSIAMMYFFLYFLLTNFNRLEALIVLMLPFDKRKIYLFGNELQSQTFSNAIGVPLIAIAQGLSAFLIYYFTNVPEASFWAILTGFASIIPIVGTGIIWIPICLFHFSTGQTWLGVTVLVWSALIMGSADNVIRFVLAKRMSDVHPVVTVLGVVIGLNKMGIPGLIFGPLLISYFIILIKIYYSKYGQDNKKNSSKSQGIEFNIPFLSSKKAK